MVLEAAVVPRDTRLAHLERSLAEKTDIVHELRQQRSMYLSQISDANQKNTEMEARVASLLSTIHEKDSLIQVLQQSFLDPDDFSLSQDNQLSSSLHHSPVSAKKFSLNGAHGRNSGGSERSPYDQLSLQIPPPPVSGSFHQRFANGAHAHASRTMRHSEGSRGNPGTSDLGSPVKEYSDRSLSPCPVKAVPSEKVSSLSLIQKANDRGTSQYYTMELPDDDMTDSGPYHHSQGGQPHMGGSGAYGNSNHGYVTAHKLLSAPTSSSAPNSPSVRKVTRKPRISQPSLQHNMHLHVPGQSSNGREPNLSNLTRLGSPPKQRNPRMIKSNTGDMRTSHIRPLVDAEMKSKTPPPNYKLVSHRHQARGQSRGGSSPGSVKRKCESASHHGSHGHKKSDHHKQRHHSVDDVLSQDVESKATGSSANSSLLLFESLLGDSLPKTSSPLVSSGTRYNSTHQHSKSSPTRELIHL